MTICVKAVFLGGIESKLHKFGSLYFKRLYGSVSPLCLRINGTGTNLNWTAHATFDPARYTVLIGARKLGLYSKRFSSDGGKVVSSQTVSVSRYQLTNGSAVMKSEKLLQGWGTCTGKNNNGAHLLRHLLQQNWNVFIFFLSSNVKNIAILPIQQLLKSTKCVYTYTFGSIRLHCLL